MNMPKDTRRSASSCLAPNLCSFPQCPTILSLDLKGKAKIKEEDDVKHTRGKVNKANRNV